MNKRIKGANMHKMNAKKKIDSKKLVWAAWTILLLVCVFFLLPFIFQIMGVNSLVVMTESMSHLKGNQDFFESYWASRGIEPGDLPFRHGINPGDLVIVAPSAKYKIGDVIVFKAFNNVLTTTHRLYQHNGTHFKDLWDICVGRSRSSIVLLEADGTRVQEVLDNLSATESVRRYEGPGFETCSYDWMPISSIKYKVVFVIPRAGLVYRAIYLHKEQKDQE